jgi:predicted NAD/FAD-dependent oxidoreductase
MAEFAIIGAGLAGTTLANLLSRSGHIVALFEKNDQCGGRLTAHRADHWQADIGAQYFTVKTEAFQQQVNRWLTLGTARVWDVDPWVFEDRLEKNKKNSITRFVGTPTMASLIEPLDDSIQLYTQTRIDRLDKHNGKWRLWDAAGEHFGFFDGVIITAPLAQSLALLPPSHHLKDLSGNTAMKPCWSCALSFDSALSVEANAVFCNNGIVSWIARDSSKPERNTLTETWVVHFSASWTSNHLQATHNLVVNQALNFLRQIAMDDSAQVTDSYSHCWLYATGKAASNELSLWDQDQHIGIAGDWTVGTRLEDAWLSAYRLAKEIQQDQF